MLCNACALGYGDIILPALLHSVAGELFDDLLIFITLTLFDLPSIVSESWTGNELLWAAMNNRDEELRVSI